MLLVQIVDDTAINLDLLATVARRLGDDVEVSCHLDPRDALAACETRMPDLIVVDYMMPGMDGHTYIEAIRGRPAARDVPVVMITAAADRSVRNRALDLGATDFLTKPVDVHEVRARLSNLLQLRRQTLKLKDRNRWLADEVSRATRTVNEREVELIVRLSKAAEFRDPETGDHIHRMADYSRLIARIIGCDDDFQDLLHRAAPMHDIGKLGIPDGILLKQGRLDEHEFSVMQRHAQIGYDILSGSASLLVQLGAEIALGHHEKFDGTGYPNRLRGTAIPLSARIVAVADVFDALTSERPYKSAWPVERARGLLEEQRGRHFDPDCVEAFLSGWDTVEDIRRRFAQRQPAPALAQLP